MLIYKVFVSCELSIVTSIFSIPIHPDLRVLVKNISRFSVEWNFPLYLAYRCLSENSGKRRQSFLIEFL